MPIISASSGLAMHPDITIVCGPTERAAHDKDAVTNPSILIEVLSRTSEPYDLGGKFEHYKTLPSLQQVVFVGYRECCIEVWTRRADGSWSCVTSRDGDVAELAIGARLDVREVYDAAQE